MGALHLAQCNVGVLRAPLHAPETAGFVEALEPLNALADAAPGFVWRLQTEEGDATAVRAFEDDNLLMNLSVWESLDALQQFTFRSAHRDVMVRRREWFVPMEKAHLVLWWVTAGTVPTPAEARARLELLWEQGPTADAFTFRTPFPAPS